MNWRIIPENKKKVCDVLQNIKDLNRSACHREERSDSLPRIIGEAVFIKQDVSRHPDCFASLAMTCLKSTSASRRHCIIYLDISLPVRVPAPFPCVL